MNDKSLTHKERALMDLIYTKPGQSVAELNRLLEDDSSYSSTRAALSRLVEKSQLETKQSGTRYTYHPIADQLSAGTSAIQRVMDTFFGGSPTATIGAVLGYANRSLSEQDRQVLLKLIAESTVAKDKN